MYVCGSFLVVYVIYTTNIIYMSLYYDYAGSTVCRKELVISWYAALSCG
jgi:hypothetical protein